MQRATALLVSLALLSAACSTPPDLDVVLAQEPWHWPEELGPTRDLDADRRTCQYDAAGFKTPYPDLYRIEVRRCLAAYGWRSGAPPPGPPPAPEDPGPEQP